MRKFTVFAVLAGMSIPVFASQRSAVSDQPSAICGRMIERMKEVTNRLRGGEQELSRPKVLRGGEQELSRPKAAYGFAAARALEETERMKARTMKTYGWIREQWMPEDTYGYTYDERGNVTVELVKDMEGDFSRTVSEYDENNMPVFKETTVSSDGVNYENNRKTEFEYDPILPKVITKRTEWMWMQGKSGEYDWQLVGNNYKRIIKRDEQGNVTSVTIAVLFEGEYDPTTRLSITYGENGEAVEIAEQVLDYNGKEYFWEEGAKVTDIVWERTDGQIVDAENLFAGANRIKKCRMLDPDGMIMDMDVTYADAESDSFIADVKMTIDDMSMDGRITYSQLENNGEIAKQEIMFMGMTVITITEEVRYDEWGLMTLMSVTEEGYGDVYSEGTRGEVDYDFEGRPATYTVSGYYTDEDTGEEISEYIVRAEYSDYVDVTAGVGSLATPDASGRWYDLQGRRISNGSAKGIVIKDGKVVKY